MKVNSNKLYELLKYYNEELSIIYDKDELYAIFELVCEFYLGVSKTEVKIKLNDNINQSELINIYNTCNELKTGKPIQYILNEAYFYNLKFYVDSNVLIPRPETEELVYLIINSIYSKSIKLNILDIGTGTGCIPITLKKHLENSNLHGIDISENALKIACSNAKSNNVNVEFYNCDILNSSTIKNLSFDYIISNPPYIINSEAKHMDERVLGFEPGLALFVEENEPIIFYKKIIDLCLNSLTKKGYLFFELNPLFSIDVKIYAESSNLFESIDIINDMSGKQRFLKAQKK